MQERQEHSAEMTFLVRLSMADFILSVLQPACTESISAFRVAANTWRCVSCASVLWCRRLSTLRWPRSRRSAPFSFLAGRGLIVGSFARATHHVRDVQPLRHERGDPRQTPEVRMMTSSRIWRVLVVSLHCSVSHRCLRSSPRCSVSPSRHQRRTYRCGVFGHKIVMTPSLTLLWCVPAV